MITRHTIPFLLLGALAGLFLFIQPTGTLSVFMSLVLIIAASFLICLLVRLWIACNVIEEINRRHEGMEKEIRTLRGDLQNLREEIRANAEQ